MMLYACGFVMGLSIDPIPFISSSVTLTKSVSTCFNHVAVAGCPTWCTDVGLGESLNQATLQGRAARGRLQRCVGIFNALTLIISDYL